MRKLLTIILLAFWTISVQSQQVIKASPNYKPISVVGGCGADLDVVYQGGTNYTNTGTFWHSSNGADNPCVRMAGNIPASEAGYYYATIASDLDSTKEAALMFTLSDVAACPPDDGWGTQIRYALFPNGGNEFYRVYEGGSVDDFTLLAIEYLAGDQYGLFRSAGGTITAQYKRAGGSWTIMHTFTQTSTADIYLAGSGLSFTTIITPKVSCNFIPLIL